MEGTWGFCNSSRLPILYQRTDRYIKYFKSVGREGREEEREGKGKEAMWLHWTGMSRWIKTWEWNGKNDMLEHREWYQGKPADPNNCVMKWYDWNKGLLELILTVKNGSYVTWARGEKSQIPWLWSGFVWIFRETNMYTLDCIFSGEKGRESKKLSLSSFYIFSQYELITFNNTNYILCAYQIPL